MIVAGMLMSFSAESPMAKLMRQMLNYLKVEQQLVSSGKPRQDYPTLFGKIKNAKTTAGKKLSAEHAEYEAAFFSNLEMYYKADDAQRKEKFNLLISTCVQCHEHECPGPISTINSYRVD